MPRQQRLALVVGAIAVLVIAFVAIPRDDEPDSDATPTTASVAATPAATPSATTEAESTPTPQATATPAPAPPLLEPGDVQRLNFRVGETIRFRVRSDTADEAHFHGYDVKKDLEAGQTVSFEVKATIPGIFEVELERSGAQVGTIRVDPK